ncbi:MAG: asparagine synthase-related protein [Saprospiraceae bacterium]|jgi:hypothetical protein|nr:asparagine synthase-related protein [Saprospiraceae bacterium]
MIIKIHTKFRPSSYLLEGKNGNFYIDCQLDPIDYFFENQQFLFLIDTNLSKDHTSIIYRKLDQITTLNATEVSNIFHDNYFMIAIDKEESKIHLLRDVSGVKTGYFSQTEDSIIVGSVMHKVAKKRGQVSYNKEAIGQLIYSNYLLNGFTIYKEVEEVKMGHFLSFDNEFKIIASQKEMIKLSAKDNDLSEKENFKRLRTETQKAHKGYLCNDNQVFLSGGLDSIAMLVALDDLETCKNLNSISFKVKDTTQDETVYAQSIAQYLKINNRIIEVDPEESENVQHFEEQILRMNNPYFGMWIFGNFQGAPNQMFYAGQDTRLHTPALNEVDKIAFKLLNQKDAKWVKYIARPIANNIRIVMEKLGLHKKPGMIAGNLYKMTHLFELKTYLKKFYLKLDKEKMGKKGIPTDYYDQFEKHFDFDLNKIKTPRALYNKLVELKWQEQYVYDMRYLQDIARNNNTYIAMPFYNKELAEFSSSIPFNIATKAMIGQSRFGKTLRIVYKYVLRHAFRDKLNDLVFYRAKAVSETLHQLFNGAMGSTVRKLLMQDLKRSDSFIRLFKLEEYTQQFLSKRTFGMGDVDLLSRVYYIATLTVYHKHIFKAKVKKGSFSQLKKALLFA